jgi:hypothetical protein
MYEQITSVSELLMSSTDQPPRKEWLDGCCNKMDRREVRDGLTLVDVANQHALELDQCKEFQHISSFPWKKFSNAGAMARRYQICLTVRNLLRLPFFRLLMGSREGSLTNQQTASLAQMVERWPSKPKVAGSTPAGG